MRAVVYDPACQEAFFALAGVDVVVENDRWLIVRVNPGVFDRFLYVAGLTWTRAVEEQRDGIRRGDRFYEFAGQLRVATAIGESVLRLYQS